MPGKYIVLERNRHFFIPGRPYLDEIVIRIEGDPKTQIIDLERQEAHLAPLFINLEGLDRLGRSEHLIVSPRGYEGVGSINWLAFNLLRKPLDDKRVRQAIAHAIDSEFLIDYLHEGKSKRATGPISPYSPFYEPNVRIYDIDLARAHKLLDQAGYPLKSDGTRFSLTIDHIPVIPSQQRDVALYIKRQLLKIGIVTQVRKSKNFPEWARRIGNWNFDMTMDTVYNWGDPVIGVHRTYLSSNITKGVVWSNTQNYRNPEVDDLLQKAAVELDRNKRKRLYSKFQRILTEELPIIWINVLPFHTVFHNGLGNPPLSIWGIHSPLDELYWEKPPVRAYVSTPALDQKSPYLKRLGVQAINLIREEGLYKALAVFQDPSQAFLELDKSGRHVVGFTRKGTVFLDNSGQMKLGMDISAVIDLEGRKLLPQFLDAIRNKANGIYRSKGVWPHPKTHAAGPMSAWCGMLTEEDVVCVFEWDRQEGE